MTGRPYAADDGTAIRERLTELRLERMEQRPKCPHTGYVLPDCLYRTDRCVEACDLRDCWVGGGVTGV